MRLPARAGATLQAEDRKVATVLLCDLVGFSAPLFDPIAGPPPRQGVPTPHPRTSSLSSWRPEARKVLPR